MWDDHTLEHCLTAFAVSEKSVRLECTFGWVLRIRVCTIGWVMVYFRLGFSDPGVHNRLGYRVLSVASISVNHCISNSLLSVDMNT